MRWDLCAEEKIRTAMEQGDFDDLLGKGQPLILRTDAFVDGQSRLAFHVMRNAKMAPRWIELDREIRERFQQAREALAFAFKTFAISEPARRHAIERFRSAITETNRLIHQLNFLVPSDRFGRPLIDAEREIMRIKAKQNSARH